MKPFNAILISALGLLALPAAAHSGPGNNGKGHAYGHGKKGGYSAPAHESDRGPRGDRDDAHNRRVDHNPHNDPFSHGDRHDGYRDPRSGGPTHGPRMGYDNTIEGRIDRGVRTGQLTSREEVKLRKMQRKLYRMQYEARRDGVLTRRERKQLHKMKERLEARLEAELRDDDMSLRRGNPRHTRHAHLIR